MSGICSARQHMTLKRARRVQRVDDDMGILAVQLLRTVALRTTTEQECGRGRDGGGVVVDCC